LNDFLTREGSAVLPVGKQRRVVTYGRARHIDVIRTFDLYAQGRDLFRIEKYSDFWDEPHGTEFDAGSPRVMALLSDWANQFPRLFRGPFVSIGFDEIFQIEAAMHASGAATPAGVFIRQLSAVARLFAEHGRQVIAYGDIMVSCPQVIPRLPQRLTAVAWHSTSEGRTYNHLLAPLVAHHVPFLSKPVSRVTTRLGRTTIRRMKTSTHFSRLDANQARSALSTPSGLMTHNSSSVCPFQVWPAARRRRGNPCPWIALISSPITHS
jgi:hypothetical protein